jgi:ADP-ribosylation factor-like protein 2
MFLPCWHRGLDNAGKTTIVKSINGEDIDTISPTLGFDIKTLEYDGYQLNIWDIGGQQTLRSYWRNYFEETDGLIWVVDSADTVRLNDCRIELEKLLQEEKLAGASLLIFANKQDLSNALKLDEISRVLRLSDENNALMQNRHWNVVPCSAVTKEGLIEGINWIVKDISSRIFMLE